MENKNKHIKYGDFVSDLINSWGFTEPQATKIANYLDFTTLYECVADYQNGDFGIGRIQTEPEWFITALEWNDSGYEDNNYETLFEYAKDHQLIDFIQDFWEIKIVKRGFKDCQEYWRQVVKDYIECSDDTFESIYDNEEIINNVVDRLLDSNELWTEIDDIVDYYLLKEMKNRNIS